MNCITCEHSAHLKIENEDWYWCMEGIKKDSRQKPIVILACGELLGREIFVRNGICSKWKGEKNGKSM